MNLKPDSDEESQPKKKPKMVAPKQMWLPPWAYTERFMKFRKWLVGFTVTWVITAAGIFTGLKYFAAPWIKTQVETRASEAIHGEVRVGFVNFAFFPSFGIRLHEVSLKGNQPEFAGQLEEMSAYLDTQMLSLLQGGAALRIRLKALHPVISSQESAPLPLGYRAQPGKEPRSLRVPEFHSPRPMSFVLDVTNGEFTRVPFDPLQGPNTWKGFEFSVNVPTINEYKAQLEFASKVTWEKNGIQVPLDLRINSSVSLHDAALVMPDVQGDVNGIPSKGSFSFDLLGGMNDVKLNGLIAEIADLKTPLPFLPEGSWKGQSEYALHFSQENDASEWLGAGTLEIKALNGTTKSGWPSAKPELMVNGFLSSDLQLDFTLARSPNERKGGPLGDVPLALSALNRLRIDRLKLWLDLSQAEVSLKDTFSKPKTTPLSIELEGTGNSDQIHVANAKLQFATLKAAGSGDWLVKNPQSSMGVLGWKLKVDPTDLADWDKYFKIFEGSPVKGRFQLDTTFSGDLKHLDQLNLAYHPLLLEKVEGNIHWRSHDAQQSMTGPIRIDGKLDLETKGKDLKLNEAKLDLDLTHLDLFAKDTINKKAGVPLTLSLEGAENKGQIEFPKMMLQVHSSQFFMACRMAQPRKPVFALNMIANKLNLGEIAEILTPLSETGLSGVASGHFTLQGTYDYLEGLKQSPLRFNSDINAEIPSVKIPNNWDLTKAESPKPAPGTPAASPSDSEPPRPAYLDWPVFKTAEMKFELLIGRLAVNQLTFEGLHSTASLQNGKLETQGAVTKFFSGSLNSAKLSANLFEPMSNVDLQADVAGVNLSEVSHTLPAGWKDTLRGTLGGHVAFRLPPLQSHSFAKDLRGFGNFNAQEFSLSAKPLTSLAQEIMQTGATPSSSSATQTPQAFKDSSLQAAFQVFNGAIAFKALKWTEGSAQFDFQGPLGFDQSIHLQGLASLPASPASSAGAAMGPAKGAPTGAATAKPSVCTNGSTPGRCVFPVSLDGTVSQASLSLAKPAQ